MNVTRRQFVKGGVTAFTFGFAAPQIMCEIAFAQGIPSRNLVVVYLGGGNDSLSTVIPYNDSFYRSRRPTLAVPAANVLQIGRDASNVELGFHPRLIGLKSIFDGGRLAIVQRTGYQNSSRSHFQGFDIWGTANPTSPEGTGWLGRYLDTLPSPVDPLVGWNTARETPRPLVARTVGVPAITLSLVIPLAWLRVDAGGITITAAMVLAAIVLVYYFMLDAPLGLAMLVVFGAMIFIGQKIADLGAAQGWTWFAVLFVGGSILQLVGHVFEGCKPALVDNLRSQGAGMAAVIDALADAGGITPVLTAGIFSQSATMLTYDAPTTHGVVELEGGARVYVQLTDVDVERVEVDMPVELTFRKYHEGSGIQNYFWKARPA